jgi:hypothetical protein
MQLLAYLTQSAPHPCNKHNGGYILTQILTAVPQTQLSPASSLHVALEVPALDVSLVDGRPQELLLLSMDGLVAEYHSGNSAGTAYTQV